MLTVGSGRTLPHSSTPLLPLSANAGHHIGGYRAALAPRFVQFANKLGRDRLAHPLAVQAGVRAVRHQGIQGLIDAGGQFQFAARRGDAQILYGKRSHAHHFQVGVAHAQNVRKRGNVGDGGVRAAVAHVKQAVLQGVEFDDLLVRQARFLEGRHARRLILDAGGFVAQVLYGVDAGIPNSNAQSPARTESRDG